MTLAGRPHGTTSAFTFLAIRGASNAFRRKLAQLKNPRYALALIFGALYMWSVLGRRDRAVGAPPGPLATHVELLAAIGLGLLVLWLWAFSRDRRALAFSPAEVAFLFTAPVPRRTLIQYKLIRAQAVILLNTLLWSVLLSPARFGAHAWMRGISVWLLLSTLHLHRLGASFVRTSVVEHRGAGLRHRLVSVAALAIIAGTLITMAVTSLPAVLAARGGGLGATLDALAIAFSGRLPSIVFAPLYVAVRPIAQHAPSEWVRTLIPAVMLLLVHYVWVVRSDAAFEEAAAEASVTRARQIDAIRRGARVPDRSAGALPPPLFALQPRGRPATAIFWKNLISVGRRRRYVRLCVVWALAVAALAFVSLHPVGAIAQTAGTLLATWAALSLVAGPQWVRNDLRTDLLRLELLRSYPVRGTDIVAAETAASTAVLTAVQLALVTLAYAAFLGDHGAAISPAVRTFGLLAALAVLPAVNFLGLLAQNGAALLFPAWIRIGSGRGGGVEAIGQNMLTLVAYALVLVVGLLVPVFLGGVAFWLTRMVAGTWGLVPAVGVLIGAIAAECAVLLRWLGRVFERIDIAESGIVAV